MAWSDESHLLLHQVDSRERVHHLSEKEMVPGFPMGRRHAGGGSMMLSAMFWWETLSRGIHQDVTLTHLTQLSIVADQVQTFMATVFLNGNGLFQQGNAPKIVQEWFEEYDKEFKAS